MKISKTHHIAQTKHGRVKKRNPKPLGTVFTAMGRIKIIDDTIDPPKWKTLETYVDTPKQRADAIKRAKKKTSKPLWSFDLEGQRWIG